MSRNSYDLAAAVLSCLAASLLVGACAGQSPGASTPTGAPNRARVSDESDGLRLVLQLPARVSAGEPASATVELINERDKPARVTGTSCTPEFGFWITDNQQEEAVFSWVEYWAETVLGPGEHFCSDEAHFIDPGQSIANNITFVLPNAGGFDVFATIELTEGASLTLGTPIPLEVRSTLNARE